MKKIIGLLLCIIFINSGLLAQNLPTINLSDKKAKIPQRSDLITGKLSNGMTYYILKNSKPENHGEFRIVVKAGAIDEDDDQDGLAHFMEHMCFNGTKNYPKMELLSTLQSFGIRFGADINAGTYLDKTQYELPVPLGDEKLLNHVFQILEDWAHNVSLNGDDIDNERGVILAEWRQRNDFRIRLQNKHAAKLYYGSKYAQRNVIGDTNIIKGFKYDVIRRFYNDWYRPDLMAIIAVGDFEPAQIEEKIKKQFGSIPPRKNPRKKIEFDMPLNHETLFSIASDKELTYALTSIVFKFPEIDETTIGGNIESIRRALFDKMLNARLTEIGKRPNTPYLQAFAGESSFYGNVRAYRLIAACQPEKYETAYNALLDEANRIKQHGFTKGEFERAKVDFLATYEQLYNERNKTNSNALVNEITNLFTDDEAMPGIDWEYAFLQAALQEIKLDEISALAKLYYNPKGCVVQISLPEKDGLAIPSESAVSKLYTEAMNRKLDPWVDVDLSKPLFDKTVKPGKIVSEKTNEKLGATELVLSNGARVILKPTNFKEDEIIFSAYSPGGSTLADDAMFESASFADYLMSETGLADYDASTVTKLLSGKNANVSTYIDEIYEGIQGTSSKKDLETLFQLIHLNFKYPRKDKESFATVFDKVKTTIANRGENPDENFRDSVACMMANHHKRRLPATLETLKKVDFDKAYQFYVDRFSNAGDFTFIFIGSFDIDEMKEHIEFYLSSLPGKANPEKWKDVGIRYPKKKMSNRFHKGTEDRSHIRLAITGEFEWSPENCHMLESLTDLLEIRLLETIREDKSGTYSPRIWASYTKNPAQEYAINIDFIAQPSRVDELIAACVEVMNKVKKSEDKDGCEKVKAAQEKQLDINIKENYWWLSNLEFYIKNGAPAETVLETGKYIAALTPATLKKAANKYLNFDKMMDIVELPVTN